MSSRRIQIFDTTLRDGEQSPGIALRPEQKAEVAEQLERLGVDVIEAGFAAASPGDFEGVRAVAARRPPRNGRFALPHPARGPRCRRRRPAGRAPLTHPHLPGDEPDPHGEEVAADPGRGRGTGCLGGRLRARPRGRGRVLLRGRDAFRPVVRRARLPRGDRRRSGRGQSPRYGRLRARRTSTPGSSAKSGAFARSSRTSRSPRTATTTSASRWRTPSPLSRQGSGRSSAR